MKIILSLLLIVSFIISYSCFLYGQGYYNSYNFEPDKVSIIEPHTETNVTGIGHIPYGHTQAVTYNDSLLYYSEINNLIISDISNPKQPKVIGRLRLDDMIEQILYRDGLLYIADFDEGLIIVDVSDPEYPKRIARYDQKSRANSIALYGDYILIAGSMDGFHMVDISDPYNPELVKYYKTDEECWRVFVHKNYAYLAEWEILHIIDISNPSNPENIVDINNQYYYVKDLINENDTLYCTLGYGNFKALDITDIQNPQEIVHFETDGYWDKMIKSGDIFYFANYKNGLSVYNMSDIHNPVETQLFSKGYWVEDIAISHNHLYVADHNEGIYIFERDNQKIKEISKIDNVCIAMDMAIKDSVAYLSSSYDGLRLIDIKNPHFPVEKKIVPAPGWGASVAIKDDRLYRVSYDKGLLIYDITDAYNIVLVDSLKPVPYMRHIYLSGDYAYVSCFSEGMMILDIEDPKNIEILSIFKIENASILEIAVHNNIAYLVEDGMDFYSVDISDKKKPVLLDEILCRFWPESVTIKGKHAFLGVGDYGILAINVGNPKSMWEAAWFDEGVYGDDVEVKGDLLYVAGTTGLFVVDVSNVNSMKRVGFYSIDDWGRSLKFVGDTVYMAAEFDGMYILKYDETTGLFTDLNKTPEDYELLQNYPNPFNSETQFSYQIPRSSRVELSIYNSLGQKITTLVDGQKTSGQYSIQWDASNRASGLYLYRLTVTNENGTFTHIKKCILLK